MLLPAVDVNVVLSLRHLQSDEKIPFCLCLSVYHLLHERRQPTNKNTAIIITNHRIQNFVRVQSNDRDDGVFPLVKEQSNNLQQFQHAKYEHKDLHLTNKRKKNNSGGDNDRCR